MWPTTQEKPNHQWAQNVDNDYHQQLVYPVNISKLCVGVTNSTISMLETLHDISSYSYITLRSKTIASWQHDPGSNLVAQWSTQQCRCRIIHNGCHYPHPTESTQQNALPSDSAVVVNVSIKKQLVYEQLTTIPETTDLVIRERPWLRSGFFWIKTNHSTIVAWIENTWKHHVETTATPTLGGGAEEHPRAPLTWRPLKKRQIHPASIAPAETPDQGIGWPWPVRTGPTRWDSGQVVFSGSCTLKDVTSWEQLTVWGYSKWPG